MMIITIVSLYILKASPCLHVQIRCGLLKHVYKLTKGKDYFCKVSLYLVFIRNLRTIDLIRNVYREHGLLGFYKGKVIEYTEDWNECIYSGISASYVGVSETIVHFVLYEQIKAQLQLLQTRQNYSSDESNLYNFISYLTAAACSKSCATTLCYPHEVVRTRLREEGTKYRTFLQTLKTVYYEESVSGLYRGLLTHLIRQIPVK